MQAYVRVTKNPKSRREIYKLIIGGKEVARIVFTTINSGNMAYVCVSEKVEAMIHRHMDDGEIEQTKILDRQNWRGY